MPQWKALPRGQRKTEDALWNELRALIDPVFERDRAEHDRERGERQAQQQAVADILGALAALADADLGVDALRHRASDLRQTFQALPARSRDDDLAFDRTYAKIERRIAAARVEQAQQQRARVRAQSARLADIEQRRVDGADAAAIAADLDALQASPIGIELAARVAAVRAAGHDDALRTTLAAALQDQDTIAELALRAELAAGLPSPEAWREQRRALQMARLAGKLGGNATSADDAASLWRAWLAVPGTGHPTRDAFDARIDAALTALFEPRV